MTLLLGFALLAAGGLLFATTVNRMSEWDPRLARRLFWMGDARNAVTARDKVRTLAYIALAFGALQIVRAIWFGA